MPQPTTLDWLNTLKPRKQPSRLSRMKAFFQATHQVALVLIGNHLLRQTVPATSERVGRVLGHAHADLPYRMDGRLWSHQSLGKALGPRHHGSCLSQLSPRGCHCCHSQHQEVLAPQPRSHGDSPEGDQVG